MTFDMTMLAGAGLIFLLRVIDVSIGTVRVIYTIRGKRFVAAAIGFVEATIFITAVTTVFQDLHNPLNILGYALGFAIGTMLGITLEGWIASGHFVARVISREGSLAIRDALRGAGFGVTALAGEGGEAPRSILFVVANRRRGGEFVRLVTAVDPRAFLTMDPVSRAMGGFMPHVAPAASLRK